jgi:hypothetical protein
VVAFCDYCPNTTEFIGPRQAEEKVKAPGMAFVLVWHAYGDRAFTKSELENFEMMQHKFRVGQTVDFFPGRGIDHRSKGRYTIVRLLPMESNTPQYRIKNNADGQERMVHEGELANRF